MILIINICKEKLHYSEFVKPVKDIVISVGRRCFVRNYLDLNEDDLKKASKVIICGTSLFDNEFIKNFHKFDWLHDFEGDVLGICSGMQIIGLVFGGVLKFGTEIGFYKERFRKEFLSLNDEVEVYHLHNNYVDFNHLGEFEVFDNGKISQAVKHKNKDIYGVLFHPEVRQNGMIEEFVRKI
jgi:anthranilate/para-aminobenzoate synthase component II